MHYKNLQQHGNQAARAQAKAGTIDKQQLQTALRQGITVRTDPAASMPQVSLMQPPGLENR
jgi:hypothetical protein